MKVVCEVTIGVNRAGVPWGVDWGGVHAATQITPRGSHPNYKLSYATDLKPSR